MRRLPIVLTSLLGVGLVACEDGPTQTYQDAPAGAATTWNNGNTPPSADSAGRTPFANPDGTAIDFGGATRTQTCTPDQLQATTSAMLNAPILPPLQGALLNIAGTDASGNVTWDGLTIDQAENQVDQKGHRVTCQSANVGDAFGDGDQDNSWGDNSEVLVEYSVQTRKIRQMSLFAGYRGTLKLVGSKYLQDTIEISITDNYVQVNGKPRLNGINWDQHGISHTQSYPASGGDRINGDNIGEAIYYGLIDLATQTHFITPTVAQQLAQPGCFSTGACITGNFGAVAYVFYPSLGAGIWIDNWQDAKTSSKPNRIDMIPSKLLSFSFGENTLRFGTTGPISYTPKPDGKDDCTVEFDQNWDDFLPHCVQTTGSGAADKVELAKLYGGIAHNQERFYFDVAGLNINFTDAQLADTDVIRDKDRPGNGDKVIEMWADQGTLGAFANDYKVANSTNKPSTKSPGSTVATSLYVADTSIDPHTAKPSTYAFDGTGNTFVVDGSGQLVPYVPNQTHLTAKQVALPYKDLHGAGYIYFEYARLVQDELNKYIPADRQHKLGDPACASSSGSYPEGCTGFETIWTPAPTVQSVTGSKDSVDKLTDSIRHGVNDGGLNYQVYGLGMKPGHTSVIFVDNLNVGAYDYGDVFSTSFNRVVKVMGKGDVQNMPSDVQDARFFFKQYFKAVVKYFEATGDHGNGNETALKIEAEPLNTDDLFFDTDGAGQFEVGEYVDRRFVATTGRDPIDLSIIADVKNGIFNSYDFSRDLYRGEEVLYAVANGGEVYGAKDTPVPLGSQTEYLSNVFGSPALKAVFQDVLVPTDVCVKGSNGKTTTQNVLKLARTADGTPVTAYYCATNYDTDNCVLSSGAFMGPPLNADQSDILKGDDGLPVLAHYPGALGGSHWAPSQAALDSATNDVPGACGTKAPVPGMTTAVAVTVYASTQQADDSIGADGKIQVVSGTPLALGPSKVTFSNDQRSLEAAMLKVPLSPDPNNLRFNSDGAMIAPKSFQRMIPWLPKQPDVGFPVAVSGTRDRFIETAAFDLSGETVTANIDYQQADDGSISLLAVESSDFLGDVFMCSDAATGDLLRVRMYTTAAEVLDWIVAHPSSYTGSDDCQLIIQYSPYGNYADYIISLTNGVRLGITQGGGFGRVNDAILFVPGQ